MAKLRDVLGLPAAYRLFGRVVAGNARAEYVRRHVRPAPGERVFDLGCGPGDILEALPDVDYVGVDLDPNYIEAARRRWGTRGEFHCEDAALSAARAPGAFDLTMANGLLHHLTDDQAVAVLRLAARLLKPGGRLVTLDGCFVAGQGAAARWFLRRDRGRHVRPAGDYAALARAAFGAVESEIRHDLLRIPYTLLIMTCRLPAAELRAAA